MELAAYAESQSLHPIAQSIQKAASASLQLSRVQEVEERAGYGVRARVDGPHGTGGQPPLDGTGGHFL